MEKFGKWEVVGDLGQGGQGKVHLVRNTDNFDLPKLKGEIGQFVRDLAGPYGANPERAELLAAALAKFTQANRPENLSALKQLLPGRENERAKRLGRMKTEVEAMRAVSHRNLIPVLDSDLQDGWFVTPYYVAGPLSRHPQRYKGNIASALRAFRPIVEAVSKLHEKNLIHRDIKPENIFVDSEEALIVGDFGLAFLEEEKKLRLTETLENVGSRDWMPGWAMTVRVEEIRPSFDVFSLGKVLWSLVSGGMRLPLWYHDKPQFSLEKMFPKDPLVSWSREILDKCVVENEEDCLKNAAGLLDLIDRIEPALLRGTDYLSLTTPRMCRACGLSSYHQLGKDDGSVGENFGLRPTGTNKFRIFRCPRCGHVDIFLFHGNAPPVWKS